MGVISLENNQIIFILHILKYDIKLKLDFP